jgi:two-component system CheB/CheR fusion protein
VTGKAYDQPNQPGGMYMGTISDITEAKKRELWNNDRLALLSHELKGPLSVIKLYVQRASKISTEKGVKDASLFLDKADEQVSRMALLMDDFLSFSTIGNTKMKLSFESFDMVKLLYDLIAQMQLKHAEYQFSLKVTSLVKIKADKRKITEVILNYLSNAVKYSQVNSRIEVKCMMGNDQVKIAVTDNGVGISPAFHERVFDRYYRTPGTNVDGFGLGLYLVKEIINQHGGRVWVESEINKGASFYFPYRFCHHVQLLGLLIC